MRHPFAVWDTLDIVFRPAVLSDSAQLLNWRNDPETRGASINTDEVPFDAHVAWLARSLKMESRRIYIAELNGWAVGTVRTDFVGGAAELSWTVSPAFRGYGIGSAMVAQFAAQADTELVAHVKVENKRSQRVAVRAGFVREAQEGGLLRYRRGSP